MNKTILVATIYLLCHLINCTVIAAVESNPIIVSNAWARTSFSPNKNSAVYMTLTNTTAQEYILIGASSIDVANNVELHKSFVDENGIGRMVTLDKLIIPANSSINLCEGGIHIMLFELKNDLVAGKIIFLDLKFENHIPLTIEAIVQNNAT